MRLLLTLGQAYFNIVSFAIKTVCAFSPVAAAICAYAAKAISVVLMIFGLVSGFVSALAAEDSECPSNVGAYFHVEVAPFPGLFSFGNLCGKHP